jgi:hypothetical protein
MSIRRLDRQGEANPFFRDRLGNQRSMRSGQFSLLSLLVCMFIAAMALSIQGGLESALQAAWLGAILLAYLVSPTKGWRQVLRVTGSTAVVWSVSVISAYAAFLHQKGAPRVGELMRHGSLIILTGTFAALIIAGSVEGMRTLWRSWPRKLTFPSIATTLCVSLFIGCLIANDSMIRRLIWWEPASEISAGDARTFLTGLHVRQRPDASHYHRVASTEANLIAGIHHGFKRISVYDASTNNEIRSFDAPTEWFSAM